MSASASISRSAAISADYKIIPGAIGFCQKRLQQVADKVFAQIPPTEEHPEFKCPITLAIMKDPRIFLCGHTFDFEAVKSWLPKDPSCPECRTAIPAEQDPIRNLALKALIEDWEQQERVPSFSHCTSENPTLAQKHLAIAYSCLEMNDHEMALQVFSKAFKHTKRSEDYAVVPALYEQFKETDKATLSYLYLVSYQLNEGKVIEALQTLQHVKEMNPALPLNAIIVGLELLSLEPNIERAMALAATEKDLEEKALMYKQVIAHFPNHLEAYELLAPLLKDPEEKRAMMLQAEEIAEQTGNSELALHFRKEAEIRYISTTVITQEQWATGTNLPPLPPALVEFLAGQCDIWPQYKRSETHIVVPLFPEVSIDGVQRPMTLESLDLLDKSSGGTGYQDIWIQIDKTVLAEKELHWAVMTKDVIPGSRNKSYEAQLRLLLAGYEVPGVLDAARAILWENRRTGTRYFNDNPWTFTRCQESVNGYRLGVGGFAPAGLFVAYGYYDSTNVGVAGFRKF